MALGRSMAEILSDDQTVEVFFISPLSELQESQNSTKNLSNRFLQSY
jgi:hypothetical protein